MLRSWPSTHVPLSASVKVPSPAPTGQPRTTTARAHRLDASGCVTLRANGRLPHIGVGRTHARTHVLLLVDDLAVSVIDADTGELLRDLVIDPTRDYQGTGRPPGPAPKKR